jgi:hypothetical protein
MPLMLLIVLNVINFGYFFFVALNLAASPRSGVEYSILGYSTPGSLNLPAAGPPSDCLTSTGASTFTVGFLTQCDLTGAVNNPTGVQIQVCSSTVGLSGSGTTETTKCGLWDGTNWTSPVTTPSPPPASDPEAPTFILNRVDVDYSFSPVIPGTPFGLSLLPLSVCSASGGNVTCKFHRQVSMREMN